jgi:hypothetical protein
MVVSETQQHIFSKFLVIDDKEGEEKKIKAYMFVCCVGETGPTGFPNQSDRFLLSTPKLLCIQVSFILETC